MNLDIMIHIQWIIVPHKTLTIQCGPPLCAMPVANHHWAPRNSHCRSLLCW